MTKDVGVVGRVGAGVSALGKSVEVWRRDKGVSGLGSGQSRRKRGRGGEENSEGNSLRGGFLEKVAFEG